MSFTTAVAICAAYLVTLHIVIRALGFWLFQDDERRKQEAAETAATTAATPAALTSATPAIPAAAPQRR